MKNQIACHIAILGEKGKLLWGKTRQEQILLFTPVVPQVGDVLSLSFWDGEKPRSTLRIRVLEREIDSSDACGDERNHISYRGILPPVAFTTESYNDLYLKCSLVGKSGNSSLTRLIVLLQRKKAKRSTDF